MPNDSTDFKEKENKKVVPKLFELGRSGTLVSSDEIEADYLREVMGVRGQNLFFRMEISDATIRKLIHAVNNSIKSAEWSIEPASDEQRDIDAAALMEQILFKDLPYGFKGKLDEILTFPWRGHAAFEPVHQNRENKSIGKYTGLKNLAFREQRTLDKWIHEDGILKYVHQIQSGDLEIDVNIPAENLLIFFNEKKGNDTGYPFLRMLYGNWKRKNLYKTLQAIGIERAALPVPHMKLPQGVDFGSEVYLDAVSQLEAFTQGEQAFFLTPHDYELILSTTGTFDPSKVQAAIKAENEEISGSLVAMWLEMGIGGNSAVGSSTGISAEFFRAGIEYLADKIKDTINLELIPNLAALNYGEELEVLPKLTHSGISDAVGKELMEIVTGYTKNGVITADEMLEDNIRKRHNLPKKQAGDLLDNQETETTKINAPEEKEEIVELSEKSKKKNPKNLIDEQANLISSDIRKALQFAAIKYTNDVMAAYKKLGKNKKQDATTGVEIAGINNLRKDLKRTFIQTVNLSIEMARKEIPSKRDVKLSTKEKDLIRLSDKYGSIEDVKLNEFSNLPTHIQVLIQKQSDLISAASLNELKNRMAFSFSSIETKSSDENIIRQSMEDEADKFMSSNVVDTKGVNSSSLMVNEGRDTFFFDDDVLEEIHSFTFMNEAPKSAICKELAGVTFNNNDAESLRYSPPLHHNCKSYLRANLKVSKGVEKLEISTLAPSAEAKKSITL